MRRRARAELLAGVCVLASFCALWGWVVVDANDATQRLDQDVQAKQARVALLQQTHREVVTLEQQRQAMLTEWNRLGTLTGEQEGPIRLLSIIVRVVDPLDVWLLHLQAKDEKVTVSGFARSLQDVVKLAEDFETMLGPVSVADVGPHVQQPGLFQFSMNIVMDATDHGRTPS